MKKNEFVQKIIDWMSDLLDSKFTGSVVLRIQFNQGGIRDVMVVEERKQAL